MIIIGDIHSCAYELETIIKEFKGEQIFSCGDTFDRGEHGVYVWELMQEYKIPAVMGNHEHKLLKFLTGEKDRLPTHYYVFLNKFAEKYPLINLVKYLQSLPYVIKLDDRQIIAHGAVDFHNPLREDLSCNVYGRFKQNEIVPRNPSSGWWDEYDTFTHKPFVYYGHVAFLEPNWRKNSLGLDTGACHGRKLSCINTETGNIFQVQSQDYFKKLKQKYPVNYKPSERVIEFLQQNT